MWKIYKAPQSPSSAWHCHHSLALCTTNTTPAGSVFSPPAEFPLTWHLPQGNGRWPAPVRLPSALAEVQVIPPGARKSAPAAHSPSIPPSSRPPLLEWWSCPPAWCCNGRALGRCSWGRGAVTATRLGRCCWWAGIGRRFPSTGRRRTWWRRRWEHRRPHPERSTRTVISKKKQTKKNCQELMRGFKCLSFINLFKKGTVYIYLSRLFWGELQSFRVEVSAFPTM